MLGFVSSIVRRKIRSASADNKSIAALIGGTAFAQGINLAFSPIATRLFSPEVFGDLAVFSSITGIVGIIVCFRYELAIVLPEDDDEGFSVFKLSCLIAVIVSIFAGIVFFWGGPSIYARMGSKTLVAYWFYVPITLVITGFVYASNYWLTRTRQFYVLSLNRIVPVLVLNLVSIGLGLIGFRDVGVRLFSIFASNVANILVIAYAIMPEFKKRRIRSQYKYLAIAVKYRRFLVYDIWSALFNNLSWMIVPILMNYYYSGNASGQYSIGMRVIQIPASIIGASISQVFIKTANERKYNKTLYPYSKETAWKLVKYTSMPILILLLCGKQIFSFVFGAEWSSAGVYAQVLAPWAFFWFVASPLSAIYTICQKQNISLITSLLNLGTRFFALYIGSKVNNVYIGLLLFSISGIISSILSIVFCFRIAMKSDLTRSSV
jgi:O-antigen/teichoic acid export membrane protein